MLSAGRQLGPGGLSGSRGEAGAAMAPVATPGPPNQLLAVQPQHGGLMLQSADPGDDPEDSRSQAQPHGINRSKGKGGNQ